MTDLLVVLLDDSVAGTLTRPQGGRLRFDYDDPYRTVASSTPLSVSVPKSVRSHSDATITPWLWGLLPDNDAVLARWARDFHAATSPFSLLSTPIGHDCAGAVRFALPDQVDVVLNKPGSVKWLTEREVAERLRALREDGTAWLGRDFTGQFSLAGAQAKTALLHQDGRWGVPSGSAATSHILKPAVVGFDDHDLNEHLCLDAARRVGLVVARTRVARFEDESAIVVDRYDRHVVDGQLLRIHQEDVCQALSILPSRKYQNEGGPGPQDVARLFRQVMPPGVAETEVSRFVDALAWNWLIAGTDAHAKNYSLLLSRGDVRFAPLYDVASALPYGRHERELRFAMKVGGDYRVDLYRNTWPRAAEDLGLDPDAVVDQVLTLAERASDAFADAAASPDVASLGRSLPTRLVDLVSDRVERCIKLLLETPSAQGRAAGRATYESRLRDLVDAVPPRDLAPADGPGLIKDAAEALRKAMADNPRDLTLVRERVVELAASALRVIRAIGRAESPPGYANPSEDRLPSMIEECAPSIGNLPIATDDPVARLVDEMIKAARRYADADPRSIYGSASERLRALFRIVGLAARALSL